MNIEKFIKLRESGQHIGQIEYEHKLSEATLYTLEIGYQCYLKRIPLDKAINIIKKQSGEGKDGC